ncbi:MAG: hypothetical protein CME68_01985 [Halobacteriovoraceae bacterium]|nr:hypothetical protein [Halobacteriovoraceae bacterium]|tara:strand:+ start:38 stop:406 length:369 start_codon:yes stop_codon:yes gene_type:complete
MLIKILVVDDEANIVEFLKEALESTNKYYIEKCTSGSVAEMLSKSIKYKLIVSDYRMPNLNGAELAKNIRTNEGPNKDVPILFVSSYEKAVLEETQDLSGIHFMNKPILIKDLFEKVENLIG